jgi:hypothetical protein
MRNLCCAAFALKLGQQSSRRACQRCEPLLRPMRLGPHRSGITQPPAHGSLRGRLSIRMLRAFVADRIVRAAVDAHEDLEALPEQVSLTV